MRTLIISAFVALFLALPGGAQATANINTTQLPAFTNPIGEELREQIFRKLHHSGCMQFEELCQYWLEGKIKIDKKTMGFEIRLATDSGTVIIGVIDDL